MLSTRRDFLKYTAIAGTGFIFLPFSSCRSIREKASFLGKIGVCTSYENNRILEEAGYAYIEESVQNFLIPLDDESTFNGKLEKFKSSHLLISACNSFIPGKLKSTGPDAQHEEILKYAETAFRRAQVTGIGIIVFGSSGSRNIPEGFPVQEGLDQFISLCSKIAPIAQKYQVTIALEPLNKSESNIINSVAEGAEIVRTVNHKNFRLLADIFHMQRQNEGPDSIIRNGDLIRHIHIAENAGREAPGVSKEDFTPFFRALKEIDYKGLMSIECSWKDISLQAGPALSELRRQIALV
jgi:sugar phosphate isomerase/epimerase